MAINDFMASLEGEEGPIYYSYPSFIRYLAAEGSTARSYGANLCSDISETMSTVAKKLLTLAGSNGGNGGNAVYLADDCAYTYESLREEFPELTLFRIKTNDSFVESPIHPGIWVETRRFADLRSLSRMRRELKRTGVANGFKAVEVVKALLGLEPIEH